MKRPRESAWISRQRWAVVSRQRPCFGRTGRARAALNCGSDETGISTRPCRQRVGAERRSAPTFFLHRQCTGKWAAHTLDRRRTARAVPSSVPSSTQRRAAWCVQLLSCAVLFKALGISGGGVGAAAAVLFAVNVTAVVPATPSNIGVFQLAVISVLTTGFGVSGADALAYGVILQAIEVATAVILGLPALVREGLTWSDMRLRALSTAPVRLRARPSEGTETASS